MTSSPPGLGIGAAAARFGLAPHVLRHWEATGLLAPGRSGAGRRRYGDDDLVRIAAIVRAKRAGLSLDTIGELLGSGAPRRRALLERHRAELVRRIERDRAALALVEHAAGCTHDDLTGCGHFRRAVTAGSR